MGVGSVRLTGLNESMAEAPSDLRARAALG